MGLSVDDLACRRGGRLVFSGLSFRIEAGEVRLLRGPNGVGKTSLLRTLAGLVPAAAGRIVLDGIGPDAADAWAERIAYAGHLDAIKLQLTVEENLAFWAGLYGQTAVGPALAHFGLAELARRPAYACSAGQRRRLGLARLLLAPRRLWLLDEPHVALDAAAVAQLVAALRAHAAAGGMALIATHSALDLPRGPDLELAPGALPAAAAEDDPFLDAALV